MMRKNMQSQVEDEGKERVNADLHVSYRDANGIDVAEGFWTADGRKY